MRKWIIVVIVFAAILIGATPALTGIIAEKKIEQLAEHISHRDGIKLTLKDYHRGWFSSTVKLNLSFDSSAIHKQLSSNEKMPPLVFETVETIHHGPVIFGGKNNLQFAVATASSVANLSADTISQLKTNFKEGRYPQLNTQMMLKFDGQFVLDTDLPELILTNSNQNSELHIEKLVGTWRMNNRAVIGELSAAKWTHTNNVNSLEHEQLTITQPKISFQQVEAKINQKYPVWIGNNLMQATELASDKNDKHFGLKNIVVNEDKILLPNQTIKATASLTFNQMMLNTQAYGPGRIITETDQLDGIAYSELQQQFNQLRKQKHDLQSALFSLLPTFHQLFFQQGARLEIKIAEITTPEGLIHAKGFLHFLKDQQAQDQKNGPQQNPFKWLSDMTKNIKFNLNIVSPIATTQKMMTQIVLNHSQKTQMNPQMNQMNTATPMTPAAAEQSAKQQLNNWVNNGSLIEKNGQYEITFNYENKDFTINGKPLNAIQSQPTATAQTNQAQTQPTTTANLIPSIAQQKAPESNVQIPLKKPQTSETNHSI